MLLHMELEIQEEAKADILHKNTKTCKANNKGVSLLWQCCTFGIQDPGSALSPFTMQTSWYLNH